MGIIINDLTKYIEIGESRITPLVSFYKKNGKDSRKAVLLYENGTA